jgi:hypothetical protein
LLPDRRLVLVEGEAFLRGDEYGFGPLRAVLAAILAVTSGSTRTTSSRPRTLFFA